MAQFFKFYKSEFNPTGLSGVVGGSISNLEVQPQLNELFAPMSVSDVVTQNQYRKVFAKQVRSGSFTGVSIELGNVEHEDQIFFNIPTGAIGLTGTASNPLSAPESLQYVGAFSGDYDTSILATASSTYNTVIPIWLRQTLAPGISDDDSARFTIRVRATKI